MSGRRVIAKPELDHLVVDVGQDIDKAEAAYRRLGFLLSPRGYHTVGSVNHVAALEGPYLELLGQGANGPARPDIEGFPPGLNGLVVASNHPEETFAALKRLEVRAQPPVFLSRPVNETQSARFGVVRLEPGEADFGRVYFCHHETPETIWNDAALQHPNGAVSIARIRIATHRPKQASRFFLSIFGNTILRRDSACWRLRIGAVDLDFVPPRDAEWWASAEGRTDYVAVLTVVTRSLEQTKDVLKSNGLTGAVIESNRIIVPARQAFNLGLEFVQA